MLVTALFIIIAFTLLAGFAGKLWFLGTDYEFGMAAFTRLNTAAFLMFFAIGGLAFLVSCICSDEKRALGISGGITFAFFTIDILAKISEKLDGLRYFTLFSFYRPGNIVQGTEGIAWISFWLLLTGLLAFVPESRFLDNVICRYKPINPKGVPTAGFELRPYSRPRSFLNGWNTFLDCLPVCSI